MFKKYSSALVSDVPKTTHIILEGYRTKSVAVNADGTS